MATLDPTVDRFACFETVLHRVLAHAQHILTKVGASSRAQIATWYASR